MAQVEDHFSGPVVIQQHLPYFIGYHLYSFIGLGSQILRDLGVRKFRLMGKPVKYNALSGLDLEVLDYVEP